MKLYQELESVFKFRILSNDDIVSYIDNVSEAGKFDEPKKVKVFALLLKRLSVSEEVVIQMHDRIAKLEEEVDKLSKIKTKTTPTKKK